MYNTMTAKPADKKKEIQKQSILSISLWFLVCCVLFLFQYLSMLWKKKSEIFLVIQFKFRIMAIYFAVLLFCCLYEHLTFKSRINNNLSGYNFEVIDSKTKSSSNSRHRYTHKCRITIRYSITLQSIQ